MIIDEKASILQQLLFISYVQELNFFYRCVTNLLPETKKKCH